MLQGHNCHMLVPAGRPAGGTPEPSLVLCVHGGVRRLPDGRPLLHVSCVDQDRAKRIYRTEASRMQAATRWGAGAAALLAACCERRLLPFRRSHCWRAY
jgi:hypothetical protein